MHPGASEASQELEDARMRTPLLVSGTDYVASHPEENPNTKINIEQVLVYNFLSQCKGSQHSTCSKDEKTGTFQKRPNFSSSSNICRICHEGENKEELVSPCNCAGSISMVHLSCMEHWLSSRSSDNCEICHYRFSTCRTHRPFCDWLKHPSNRNHQRGLLGDILCFLLLTPLAAASTFFCLQGALVGDVIAWWETACLVALATFLLGVYSAWCVITIKFHYRCWLSWRDRNQYVKVVLVHQLNNELSRSSVRGVPAIATAADSSLVSQMRSPGGSGRVFLEDHLLGITRIPGTARCDRSTVLVLCSLDSLRRPSPRPIAESVSENMQNRIETRL